jgi:FkbM family methyltransferase
MQSLSISGVSVPFEPSVITPNIAQAIETGRFEAEEAAEIPTIVKTGDRVLEIGAGIGFISTLLDREQNVERIIAVEANPALLPYMETLHQANGVTKVTRKNVVLTNETCAAKTFYLREDFWMGSLASGPNPYVSTVEVPTANFNALISDERISIIVCDVEGAESFIFDDADLTGVDRVYLELHDHITGLKGVQNVFGALAGLGFAYDPRHSKKSVVLFRRVEENEVLRPYDG